MKRIFFCVILLLMLWVKLITSKTNTIFDLHNKIVKSGVCVNTITASIEGYITSTKKSESLSELFSNQLNSKKSNVVEFNPMRSKLDQPAMNFKVIPTTKQNVFFVTVMLSQQKDVKNINNIIGKVIQIFKKFKGKPVIYVGFDGIINKKMSKVQMKNKACEILIACGSKNIREIDDSNFISIIGWTPFITNWININGVKENLNIALKCIDNEGCTKLWAFSPLIQKEY